MELVQLRVKVVDFQNNVLPVGSGKGDKDRTTLLPDSIREPLRVHLHRVRDLYENDLKIDHDSLTAMPHCPLPFALDDNRSDM
ncbi:MAG: hypothetical protein KAJ45_01660 [Desulfobulbaceae bacterium]|nr:hypothetical protein [Desulfobulbaceae bacterium]